MSRTLTVAAATFCAVAVLGGCVEGTGIGSSRPDAEASAAPDRPAATGLVDRDVEAPEVFQQTEAGLWDGRPSLGGVWVAHPDVTDPERVIVRNNATGETVIGALFRRERNNPGPRIQVSSDAAAALGLIAGAPTELSVTALRREEAPTPEAPSAAEDETALAAAESSGTEPDDSVAEAAIERAETTEGEVVLEIGEDGASADVAVLGPTEDAPERAARRGGFLSGLFGQRRTGAPLSALPEAGDGVATGAVLATDSTIETAALEAPAETRTAVLPSAAEIVDDAEPEAAAESIELAAAEPEPTPIATALGLRSGAWSNEPFVEIGTFSSEENAKDAAATMREDGILPTIRTKEANGTTLWRVVAGPAQTRMERSALLRKVKRLGFEDAYTVAE